MIFVPRTNIWTPECKWGQPKYQKGMLHPVGFWAEAAGPSSPIVTLTSLVSDNDVDEGLAGVRCLRDGHVQEIQSGGAWVSQGSGTQYVDDNTFDVGDDFEVMLSGSGSVPVAGPALDTWLTISVTRQWTLEGEKETGPETWNGTMTVREIADTGNTDSASVSLTAENTI